MGEEDEAESGGKRERVHADEVEDEDGGEVGVVDGESPADQSLPTCQLPTAPTSASASAQKGSSPSAVPRPSSIACTGANRLRPPSSPFVLRLAGCRMQDAERRMQNAVPVLHTHTAPTVGAANRELPTRRSKTPTKTTTDGLAGGQTR